MIDAMTTTNKLSLAWNGVYETFKLDGIWSQPSGDRKLFTIEVSTILWRKSKNLLSFNGFNGSKANDFKKELCKRICECEDDISEPVSVHDMGKVHSGESSDLYTDIECMKQDQLANGEAIRSLLDSILHITSVISEFQDFIGKNKTSLTEGTSIRSINHNEERENVNQVIAQDCIETDSNDTLVSEQLKNSVGNNEAEFISQLDESKEAQSNMTDETLTDKDVGCVVPSRKSYAQAVKMHPKPCKPEENPNMFDNPEDISLSDLSQRNTDGDGFIGVDRRRKRVKKLFLSGIHESVQENQILSYLEQRNIILTHIALFRSQRRGTRSAKIHIPSSMWSQVQSEGFWPKFVKCSLWQSKNVRNPIEHQTKINTTHHGNFSTYV